MIRILATAVVCLLLNQGQCKQESTLTSETSSWDKAGDPSPPVQLDPELRSALLRALTELEKEAQHQSGDLAPNPVNGTSPDDDPIQENLKRDLQELISNLNGPAPYPEDQQEEDQETSDGKEPSANYEGSVSEPSRPDLGDNKYPEQDSYQQRVQQVTDFLTGSDLKHKLSSQSIEQPGNLLQQDEKEIKTGENSNQAAIFFHNPDPIELGEQKDELESRTINTAIDISSNVIPSSTQEVSVSPRGAPTSSAADTNVEKTSVSIDSSVSSIVHENTRDKGTSDDGTKPEVEDGDVSIFHAPLVAAFTVHQDEKGNPQSVIPLLRPARPAKRRPQLQQQQQLFVREQDLVYKTRLLENQLLQLQQQQQQQQTFQQQQQQQTFQQQQQQFQQQQQQFQQQQQYLKQQQFRLEEQHRRERQQQLYREEQQRLRQQQALQPPLIPQQPFIPLDTSHRLRPQRQESGTGIVDFQPSVGFHFTQTQQQPSPQNTNNFQSAASFLVHQRAQPPLPLNNFNGNFVQQKSQGFVPIASQQQNSFFRSNGFSQQFPSQPNGFSQRFPSQPNGFSQQFPSQPNGFFPPQPQSTRSNGFNNFRQQTQSLDSQLQNLLYQSGVAEDFNGIAPQEDLNIVSKVLSLNHEGRPQLRKTRGSPIEDGDKPKVEIQTQST